jgi:hypothetical protein
LVIIGGQIYTSKVCSGRSINLLDVPGADPRSILNQIRKLMFNFLWKGNKDSNHYHLCRWDVLSGQNPVEDGASAT